MVGAKTIEIDWKDFVRGMGTSNYTSDAGFSIGTDLSVTGSTSHVNLTVNPGAISFPATPTDKSTSLVGNMLASCENPTIGGGGNGRLYVSTDSNQDGNFYSSDSTGTLTARGASDALGNYIYGGTDMIGYKAVAFVTNSVNIVKWVQPNTFTYDWGNFSDTFSPHPAITYEDSAYFGDGNILLRTSDPAVTPSAILTLPDSQVIVALGIDPGSGKMLISVVDQYSVYDGVNSQARVLYYDGFSNKVSKVVLTDDMILAFYNVGGTVFCTYGQKLGYWTGAGIQFLRALNVGLDETQLPYKNKITNIGEILYIAEKSNVLAYGQVTGGGPKAFWYALGNAPNGTPTQITLLVNIGSNILSYGYASAKFFTLDTSSFTSLTNGTFFSQNYNFERVVGFAQVIIQYISPLPLNTDLGTIQIFDENGVATTLDTVKKTENTTLTWIARQWQGLELRSIQLKYIALAANPIFRITIFYNEKD